VHITLVSVKRRRYRRHRVDILQQQQKQQRNSIASDHIHGCTISQQFQHIQISSKNPFCLLIINIHCPAATQRPLAPQIQALLLTIVHVIKYLYAWYIGCSKSSRSFTVVSQKYHDSLARNCTKCWSFFYRKTEWFRYPYCVSKFRCKYWRIFSLNFTPVTAYFQAISMCFNPAFGSATLNNMIWCQSCHPKSRWVH